MANDITSLTVVGNLTADPELRYLTNGTAVAKFTVAQTPRVLDKASGQWKDGDPLFLTCTAWRDLAKHIAESLTRGARVVVTGRLKLSRWETPEGDKRSAYGLDVDDIGPSLRWATAKVQKMTRTNGNGGAGPVDIPPNDPWAVATPARTAANGGATSDEPPF
ncbi:single-stranded DNA-binding protein [Micromonospora sp. WMMD1102]|uniref:single-stranded DNA-binding protein n=1 Tax=Micromonospora sp. WMMD1102 TaxID=3016105 RepID=UPI002414FF23|nr:single-stranded DNA-binding protein [Micromonospora sp. WMMD1102]MDG4790006.1 single-stranded DNA-binding protein [Micromonospora sp. WMMD1102]